MHRKTGPGTYIVLIMIGVTSVCGAITAVQHDDDTLALLLLTTFALTAVYIASKISE